MNIGQASKASGVSAKMIRYYEQIELIPPITRTSAGYRAYSDADINRLQFIRRARDLGFSVAEIGQLLGLWINDSRQSADVKHVAQTHIKELKRRMQNLQHMIDTLQSLVNRCAGDAGSDCPILQSLENDDVQLQEPIVRKGVADRHAIHATANASKRRSNHSK